MRKREIFRLAKWDQEVFLSNCLKEYFLPKTDFGHYLFLFVLAFAFAKIEMKGFAWGVWGGHLVPHLPLYSGFKKHPF